MLHVACVFVFWLLFLIGINKYSTNLIIYIYFFFVDYFQGRCCKVNVLNTNDAYVLFKWKMFKLLPDVNQKRQKQQRQQQQRRLQLQQQIMHVFV